MNTQLEQTLGRIARALEFDASGAFTFAGRPSMVWTMPSDPIFPTPLTPNAHPTVTALKNAFYAECYTQEFSGAMHRQPAASASLNDEAWVALMSAANPSRERWESGWQIQEFLPNGQITARKGAVERAFWAGEFVRETEYGAPPGRGTPVAVFLPREARKAQPGFYFVFGETPASRDEEAPAVRFYWHVKRAGGAALVHKLAKALNRYHTPFRFKIVSDSALLNRTDCAVLYVGRRFYRMAAEIALEIREQIADGLEANVPLFTLRLGDGLAFAEDPGTNESFGEARCRLLAEGFWSAFCEGRRAPDERLQRVRQHFEAAGLSLERPYLNHASIQSYEFPQ